MSGDERPGAYSRKTLVWIAGLGVGSFVLALVLTAFADDLGRPASAGANSFSDSAVGHRAMVEFLERSGLEVRVRRTERLDSLEPSVPVLAAEPRVAVGAAAARDPGMSRLFDAVRDRQAPLVVVLPKWQAVPNPSNPRWVSQVGIKARGEISAVLRFLNERLGTNIDFQRRNAVTREECETAWGDPVTVGLEGAMLLKDEGDLEPLVSCDEGWLAARHEDEHGHVTVVVSDPDLLSNHGLGRQDNASVLHGLIVHGMDSSRLVVDETIHGFTRNSGLLAELFRFPLVLGLAHGTLGLALVLWAGMGRFGKPRVAQPAFGSGKGVLIDNTAKLLSVVGHTPETLPRYFRQTLRAVAARYFLPADLPQDVLLSRLEQISRARKLDTDLQQMKRRFDELAGRRGEHADKAVKLAMRMHRWRREMTDVD